MKNLFSYLQDKKKCNAGKFCSRECFYKSPERRPNKGKLRENSIGWKGGRIFERGYKMVIAPENHPYGIIKGGGLKYIREHRLVMEKHIGRYLNPKEHIHHINGIKSDNRIDNLQIVKPSEHNRYHMNKYWEKKKSESMGIS